MASFSGKTPVSILNEYGMKKGLLPKFELIINGRGMAIPKFVYGIQFENHMSMGEGRSKQEAKHEAAKNMLQQLKISFEGDYEEDVTNLIVPHQNNIGYNAVGALADFCGRTCYPDAVYDLISEVGPPHEKTFTVKCSVSKLSAIGEARTKKEAKRIAAHKLLVQLQQEAGEEPMAVALTKPRIDDSNVLELPRVAPVYQPHAQLYKDFCHAYINLEEKSETLTRILNDWNSVSVKNACKSVLDISNELVVSVFVEKIGQFTHYEFPINVLEIDYSECSENVDISKDDTVFITMQLHPPVVGMGKSVPEAALNLLDFLRQLTT